MLGSFFKSNFKVMICLKRNQRLKYYRNKISKDMNSNSNTFVSAYQAYIEYFRKNFPFAPPPPYQD